VGRKQSGQCDERNILLTPVIEITGPPVAVIHIVTMDLMPATDVPTVLTTRWCGYCRRLKSQLDRAGIEFREIEIEDHAEGAAMVAQINDGNLTVPTVLFRDGSELTNPSAAEIGRRLS
jgi:mycoredoxin